MWAAQPVAQCNLQGDARSRSPNSGALWLRPSQAACCPRAHLPTPPSLPLKSAAQPPTPSAPSAACPSSPSLQRNYRFFLTFVYSTVALCCWVFALSVANLVIAARDAGWSFGTAAGDHPAAIVCAVYTFLVSCRPAEL